MRPLRTLRPLTSGAAIVAVVLMGAALLLAGWTTYAGVRDASATLLRGQADGLEHAVRAELGPSASGDEVAAFLDDHSDEGVRYVALIEPVSGAVLASAGTPAGGAPERIAGIPALGREVTAVDGRIRLDLRQPRRPFRNLGRPPRAIVEFEPVQQTELRTAAARTFGIGALAATIFLGVAVALVRWTLRREAEELRLAHERRLASLGEMSAVLAHEIKNPLASLKGNAQLLAESLAPGDKPRQKADRVVAEAVRLEALTQNLLSFVKTGELGLEPVDPGRLLRDAAATIDSAIEIDVSAAPPSWRLDGERTRQVLTNLLDNAVAAGGPVRGRVAVENRRLVFEVADHGPGVAAEDRERIFEPFFTRRSRGTGLGLAVAQRVVELHGGRIVVDDAPGGGARFRVEIPA